MTYDTPLYEFHGDSLRDFSPAVSEKIREELKNVDKIVSEVGLEDINRLFSLASDKARDVVGPFKDQLSHLSVIIEMLSDPSITDSLNFDAVKLADLTSQTLIALKLLGNDPSMTNCLLVFTSFITKLNLSEEKMRHCVSFIKDALKICFASISSTGFKSEASVAEFVNVLTGFCGGFRSVVDDKIIDIVLTFLAKCIAFWTTISGGFPEESLNIDSIPRIVEKMRAALSQGSDLIECLLCAQTWVYDNFPKFIKGDFEGIYLGKEETRVFEAKVSLLKKINALARIGSWDIIKQEHGHTDTSFIVEVSKMIKLAKNLMKSAKPAQMPALKRYLDELYAMQVDVATKRSQIQSKITAMGVCFVGPSGVGKSLLMEQTSRSLISAAGEVPCPEVIVTGQMSDRFDSNEMPHHLSIQYDDVGNNSANENFDKLLNAVNSQARPFLKAGVEEKGCMFPGNIACVISTNVPGLNAHKSNCPDSIARRFLHINVQIKDHLIDEICVPGTKRVDPLKALDSNNLPRMDIWKFDVYQFITFDRLPELPEGCIEWEGMVVRPLLWSDKAIEFQTYWDLASFLSKSAKQHFDRQEKALNAFKEQKESPYCTVCCIPESVCSCALKSEWFGVEPVDMGLQRAAECYTFIYEWLHDFYNAAKLRAMWSAVLLLVPVDLRKMRNYALPIWCLACILGQTMIFSINLAILFCVCMYLFEVYKAYIRVRNQLEFTSGVLTQFAEDSVQTLRRYRNSIFVGAAMVSFVYAIYRLFRPRSEQISYRESLPENCRNAFIRAQQAKTTPLDNILPHIKKDLGRLKIEVGGKVAECFCFPIESNCYVTVNHALPKEGEITIYVMHDNSLTPTVAKQKLGQEHIYRFEDKDLAIFKVPSAVPRRGYKNYLLGRPTLLGTQVIKIVSMNGRSYDRTVSDTRMEPGWSMLNSWRSTDKVSVYKPYQYAAPLGTRDGMCGSLIIDFAQSIIYGFHIAGNGKTGLMTTLTIEDVDEALNKFRGFIPLNQGELQLGQSNSIVKDPGMCAMKVGDEKHDKELEDHNCITEGSLPGGGATFKHPYVHHPFYDTVVKHFGPPKYGPPQKINDDFHKRKALTKLTDPNQEFSLVELDMVKEDYIAPIRKLVQKMPVKQKQDLARVLTVQEALDGIGEACLGGIDNSTSVGFPFRGKKKDYMERDPMDPSVPITPRTLTPRQEVDMLEEIDAMRERYLCGMSARPLFKASMKSNELLPVEKFKARVFMGCNFPFLILCRQYLSPIIRLISKNKFLFETAKGINMDSVEAEELYNFLKVEEGKRVVALDYSAYDQTMSAQITTTACSVFYDVMKEMGCSDEHLLIVRGLLTDIVYPNINYFGTIIQLANSDPSGQPLTTELNGVVNSLYLRSFFFRIYPELINKVSYRSCIKTMTYGDDNINGVAEKYARFNGFNIVEQGKKVGLTITMADKDADVYAFASLEDSDFLKRKFRKCPDLKRIRASLAKSSIEKSIHWMKKTSPDCPEVLFSQTVDGMLRKASQHGRDYFEEIYGKLYAIAEVHEVVPLCKWWKYDELIEHDRINYYDNYSSSMGGHPFTTPSYQTFEEFVSEVKKKNGKSYFGEMLVLFKMVVTLLTCTVASTTFIKWWENGGSDMVIAVIKDYLALSAKAQSRFDDQLREAYAINGFVGVCEFLHIPVIFAQWWSKIQKKTDTEPDDDSFGSSINNKVDELIDDAFDIEDFKSESRIVNVSDSRPRMLALLYDAVDSLASLRPFLVTGRQQELGLNYQTFMTILGGFIISKSLIGVSPSDGPIVASLNIAVRESRRMFVDTWLKNNNDLVRKQAFCVYLEGPPGCGKTFVALLLAQKLIPNLKKHEMIVLNEEDEFQSELRSHHRVIMMDDIGNTKFGIQEGNPLRRPLDFVNNTPRRALNPEAELKGNIVIRPELVILTSNVPAAMMGCAYSNVPSSLYRRWVRVCVRKKRDFEGDLDTSKWEFELFNPQNINSYPRDYDNLAYENEGTKIGDIHAFLDCMKTKFDKHINAQEQLVLSINKMFTPKTWYQSTRDYLYPPKMKSETLDWDTELISRLEAVQQVDSPDDIKKLIRVFAMEMSEEPELYDKVPEAYNPAEIPREHWVSRWLRWLGIYSEPLFSEATNKPSNLSGKMMMWLDINRHHLYPDRDYFVCDDYIFDIKDNRLKILTFGPQAHRMANLMLTRTKTYFEYGVPPNLTSEDIKFYDDLQRALKGGCDDFKSESLEYSAQSGIEEGSILGPLDKHFKEQDERKTVEAYIKLFGIDTIAKFLVDHTESITQDRLNALMMEDELDNVTQSETSDSGRCDLVKELGGFVHPDFPLLVGIGSCPSVPEAIAQDLAVRKFTDRHPSAILCAREITIDDQSLDLVFKVGASYHCVEAKMKGKSAVRSQAVQRKIKLQSSVLNHFWFYTGCNDTLERL